MPKQEYTQNKDVANLAFTPDVTTNEDTFLTTGWIVGSNGIAFDADDPDLLWAYDVENFDATTGLHSDLFRPLAATESDG